MIEKFAILKCTPKTGDIDGEGTWANKKQVNLTRESLRERGESTQKEATKKSYSQEAPSKEKTFELQLQLVWRVWPDPLPIRPSPLGP